jgi:hypothetical protein
MAREKRANIEDVLAEGLKDETKQYVPTNWEGMKQELSEKLENGAVLPDILDTILRNIVLDLKNRGFKVNVGSGHGMIFTQAVNESGTFIFLTDES